MANNCNEGCNGDMAGRTIPGFNNRCITGERIGTGSVDAVPPLPEPITIPSIPAEGQREPGAYYDSAGHLSILQEGCYYARLMTTALHTPSRVQYEGTFRFQRINGTIIAGGDLYKKNICESPTFCPSLSITGESDNGIPVFPRSQYGFYLRVTGVKVEPSSGTGVYLEMEPYHFDHSNHTWHKGELLTVQMNYSAGPDGIHYWHGDLKTRADVVMGQLVAVRISSFLRQAVIEIDRVKDVPCPTFDETGSKWLEVFKKAGWDITVRISDKDVEEPTDGSWSNGELHRKMLEYRDKVDLDKQWHYHMLAVRRIDDGAFGVMYDNTIKGVNDIPREGAAVAAEVAFPDDHWWGNLKGKLFKECHSSYVRTAIHEIGHAMMLYHPDNPHENYIMQKTENIAMHAVPPKQFPENIQWSFSPRDVMLLCHLPDIAIRPGGISFGTPHQRMPGNVRDEVMEADGLELKVEALNDVVPMGAPVRVNFTLINHSDKTKRVPGSLRMKSGHVSGRVIDPLGSVRDFATILQYTSRNKDVVKPQELKPGACLSHSATLLWGTEGPLFPCSGFYRVVIELNWHLEGIRMRLSGHSGILVTAPVDEAHGRAALRIFSTPEAILSLAVGGDHLETGNEAIRAAISHPVLKPHYQLVEARRVGQRFYDRSPGLKEMAALMDETTSMTPTEMIRFAKILNEYVRQTKKEDIERDEVEKVAALLLKKAEGTTSGDAVKKIINEAQELLDQ